jgi:hypothetical protein
MVRSQAPLLAIAWTWGREARWIGESGTARLGETRTSSEGALPANGTGVQERVTGGRGTG